MPTEQSLAELNRVNNAFWRHFPPPVAPWEDHVTDPWCFREAVEREYLGLFPRISHRAAAALILEKHFVEISLAIDRDRANLQGASSQGTSSPGSSLQCTCGESYATSASGSTTLVDMSNRHVQPSGSLPAGLREALAATGRTRGSSATPAPPLVSPQPNRSFQSQINNIENAMQNTRVSQGGNRNTASNSVQSSPSQNPGGAPNHPRSQGLASSMHPPVTKSQGLVLHQGYRGAQNTGSNRGNVSSAGPSSAPMIEDVKPAQLSVLFRAKVREVQQIFAQASIPAATKEIIKQQIIKVIQEFDESERRLKQEYEKREKEHNQVKQQLSEAQQQIANLVQDRSKISTERDDLLLKVNDLTLKTKTSSERIQLIESKWKDVNHTLLEKVRVQEEQLKGKRALWLEANPTSSARRDAMTAIRDPFNSPSASHTPGFATSSMGSMGSLQSPAQPSFGSFLNKSQSTLAPPKMNFPTGQLGKGVRRRPAMNLPIGRAAPSNEPYTVQDIANSSRTYNTEPADDTPSMALVLHSREEQLAIEYKLSFHKLYAMIETWVRKYTHRPHPENDRLIGASNQVLWDYMMNCTYPGHRQDSHNHVIALLNDARCRFWFVMRMISTYCTKDITTPDAFVGFDGEVDRVLDEVKKAMQERGLANERRQRVVDQQARAIQSIISSPKYGDFRASKLNAYTKRLRDMIGPLLNSDAARADAGQELGGIVITAWDLAIKMTTSHLTFQVYFPETCSKFTAATMHAKDSRIDAMQLQIQQARLKLVITPVITMRDDRGTTIMAKSILPSDVLLMG